MAFILKGTMVLQHVALGLAIFELAFCEHLRNIHFHMMLSLYMLAVNIGIQLSGLRQSTGSKQSSQEGEPRTYHIFIISTIHILQRVIIF